MLADLARLLNVSTDWLLGLCTEQGSLEAYPRVSDTDRPEVRQLQLEMGNNLRNCLSPLELAFGEEIIPVFVDGSSFLDQIRNLKRQLSTEGIWTPVIRVCDLLSLGKKQFIIRSFHNSLYTETLDNVNQETLSYIIRKLEETIRNCYHEILYPDLMKNMVDNLKIEYPALIEDIVPEKISYGLLTETVKTALSKGSSIYYLPKMIEIMECALRRNPAANAEGLAGEILRCIH